MNFVVLPDSPAAESLAKRHREWGAERTITHASGRPWVVGRWSDDDVDVISAGDRRLAIFGYSNVAAENTRQVLGRATSTGDLDAMARQLAGCFHLTASVGGRTWSRGSLSTVRQIFYSSVEGVTIAADSPRPLAALREADLDYETLALRLLVPVAPWPLSQRPFWQEVRELAVGHWLEIGPDGRFDTKRWWNPPPANQELADTARSLRRELLDALAVRARRYGEISSDLSGGLDSTSLCFLAAAAGAELVTHHWAPKDRTNDDTVWAQRAAAHLAQSRHRFHATDDSPTWYQAYADQEHLGDHAEGPAAWTRHQAQLEQFTRTDAAEGIGLHLLGLGGDELFAGSPTYLWSLVRAHPLRSLATVNRRRIANRWGLRSTLRGLADGSAFKQSLVNMADQITAPEPPASQAPLGWHGGPRMPPWATADATATVRRLLRDAAAGDPQPFFPDRVRHQMLEAVAYSGCAVRQINVAFAGHAVEWSAPYLDDRVIDVAMRVRIEDRAPRGTVKPLLTAAMRGVVPDEVLDRRTKGEYSAEDYQGLSRHRRPLLEMCEDLRLAQAGLVDPGRLARSLTRLSPESQDLTPLHNTLACEAWLRSQDSDAPRFVFPPGETECRSLSAPTQSSPRSKTG